jgi:hypothetical protein
MTVLCDFSFLNNGMQKDDTILIQLQSINIICTLFFVIINPLSFIYKIYIENYNLILQFTW